MVLVCLRHFSTRSMPGLTKNNFCFIRNSRSLQVCIQGLDNSNRIVAYPAS
jgi:hypothetical protein